MIMVDMVTPFAVQVTFAVLQFVGISPSAALGTIEFIYQNSGKTD